ncbi:unnamed protein product [Soboliphyme baturini]|uniref:Coiled-coil domain-containing protein 62 n=1 Tax=Soboliphyme baturini TaxID=241478 RepID=A0A183INA9_9BILA|nr:unnamed protein product [Soboliphyme baturini]
MTNYPVLDELVQFPRYCGIEPESECTSQVEAAAAADEWEDDFLFTQPDVIQIIDTQVQNVIHHDSKVREYCKSRTDDVLSQFHPEVAPVRESSQNLLSADDIYIGLDQLNQECEKYKIEAQKLKEELTVKEGEIKILREWKATRDREELKKQSESCAAMQAIRMKQQAAEVEHRATINSLKTQLKFMEQEKMALEEKLLEEKSIRTVVAETSSAAAARLDASEPMEVTENGQGMETRNRTAAPSTVKFPDVRDFYSNKRTRLDAEPVAEVSSMSCTVQTDEASPTVRPYWLKRGCRIKKSLYEVYLEQLEFLAHEHPPTVAEKIQVLRAITRKEQS